MREERMAALWSAPACCRPIRGEVSVGDVEAALSHLSWNPMEGRARSPLLPQERCVLWPPGCASTAQIASANGKPIRPSVGVWRDVTAVSEARLSQWERRAGRGGGLPPANQRRRPCLYMSARKRRGAISL
ncbi:hypothetical protein FKM82_028720 [Ascaphus truei]